MRIDLNQRYTNADGTTAYIDNDRTKDPVTLKWVLERSCLADVTGEFGPQGNAVPVPGGEKPKRYELYLKIHLAGEFVDLKAEEITDLKRWVQFFGVLTVGQTHALLEGEKQRTDQTPSRKPPKTPPPLAAV